jgi:predicted transcriptional regulator
MELLLTGNGKSYSIYLQEALMSAVANRAEAENRSASWIIQQATALYLSPNRLGAFAVIRSALRQAQAAGVESADALELLEELEG